MRRAAFVTVLLFCLAYVGLFQATRPVHTVGNPVVFVPEARFFEEFSPGFRTSIADVYWLQAVQYYGEHIDSDGRLDSLAQMLDLVTTLAPRFKKAYFFGAFALIDAGQTQQGYDLLKRGFAHNRDDWHFPAYLGFFAYAFGPRESRAAAAGAWYQQAAAIPGAPNYAATVAARLLAKGGDRGKAIVLLAQVYAEGDKYAQEKAVTTLRDILPAASSAREKALLDVQGMMSAEQFDQLLSEVMGGR